MMYGLNAMGSHASQTNEKERWQITMHVMNLKATMNGEPLWSDTQKKSGIISEEDNSTVTVETEEH